MKRVVYLRVSTEDQSLDSQRLQIQRYLSSHDLQVEFYEEFASGGSTKKRPVYQRLMREVKRGEIGHIYVYKLDRFSRNTKDFLIAHEVMEENKTKFISISDNLDFSTPVGRMFAQMLSIFAEFERNQLISRTKAGLEAAKAKGVHCGRKASPINWAQVKELRKLGRNVRAIAKALGISGSQLYRRLNKEEECA